MKIVNGERVFFDKDGNLIEDNSCQRPIIYNAEIEDSEYKFPKRNFTKRDTEVTWHAFTKDRTRLLQRASKDERECVICKRNSVTDNNICDNCLDDKFLELD